MFGINSKASNDDVVVIPVNVMSVVDVPVKVSDTVWFVSDDELTAGMVVSGVVQEITLDRIKLATDGAGADVWNVPLSWVDEGLSLIHI